MPAPPFTYTFSAQLTDGSAIQLDSENAGFVFTDSSFDRKLPLNTFQKGTHIVGFDGDESPICAKAHVNNTEYQSTNYVNLNRGTPSGSIIPLSTLTTTQMPLRIDVTSSTAFKTTQAKFWVYDPHLGEDLAIPGLDVRAFELQQSIWTTLNGAALTLQDHTTANPKHTFYVGVSAKATSLTNALIRFKISVKAY